MKLWGCEVNGTLQTEYKVNLKTYEKPGFDFGSGILESGGRRYARVYVEVGGIDLVWRQPAAW